MCKVMLRVIFVLLQRKWQNMWTLNVSCLKNIVHKIWAMVVRLCVHGCVCISVHGVYALVFRTCTFKNLTVTCFPTGGTKLCWVEEKQVGTGTSMHICSFSLPERNLHKQTPFLIHTLFLKDWTCMVSILFSPASCWKLYKLKWY